MKIKSKILLPVLSVIVLGLLLLGFISYDFSINLTTDMIENQLQVSLKSFVDSLQTEEEVEGVLDKESFAKIHDFYSLENIVENLELTNSIEAYIVNLDGEIVAHTDSSQVGSKITKSLQFLQIK